jgi:hypothetical protein
LRAALCTKMGLNALAEAAVLVLDGRLGTWQKIMRVVLTDRPHRKSSRLARKTFWRGMDEQFFVAGRFQPPVARSSATRATLGLN